MRVGRILLSAMYKPGMNEREKQKIQLKECVCVCFFFKKAKRTEGIDMYIPDIRTYAITLAGILQNYTRRCIK